MRRGKPKVSARLIRLAMEAQAPVIRKNRITESFDLTADVGASITEQDQRVNGANRPPPPPEQTE